MPTTLLSLPIELLSLIAHHGSTSELFDRQTWRALCLTCWQLYHIAVRFVYQRMRFVDDRGLRACLKLIEDDPRRAAWAESFVIESNGCCSDGMLAPPLLCRPHLFTKLRHLSLHGKAVETCTALLPGCKSSLASSSHSPLSGTENALFPLLESCTCLISFFVSTLMMVHGSDMPLK